MDAGVWGRLSTAEGVDVTMHMRRVVCVKALAAILVGRTGVCTAELKEQNIFAVWFDEPIVFNDPTTGNIMALNWWTMEYGDRAHFALAEA